MSNNSPIESKRSDAAYWAEPVSRLEVAGVPAGAINLNVDGRQIAGPLQGFGQLWQKTYRIRLAGAQVTPQEVIQTWKANFGKFWPKGNKSYGSLTGIAPGDVAVLNLAGPGGMPLSTGIIVIYADDESFSFMDPEGHMFAAMITFSAFEDEGVTVAQVQPLIRANDPFYELGMRLGVIPRFEDRNWHATLTNLAAHFGVKGVVQQQNALLDSGMQWNHAKNIWHNAAIRTALYTFAAPVRNVAKRVLGFFS